MEPTQLRWKMDFSRSAWVRPLKSMSHNSVFTFSRCKSSSTNATMRFADVAGHRYTGAVTEVANAEDAVAARKV